MSRFLLRRLLLTIPVLFGVATLVFALIHLVPVIRRRRCWERGRRPRILSSFASGWASIGPCSCSTTAFLSGLVRGDLGVSISRNQPVTTLILERMPATAELAFAAMAVAMALAIPLGIAAAVWKSTAIDQAAMTLALLGISVPNFWLGPLMAILFSVELGWLPVSGRGTWQHLVLPATTLGAALAAILARMTRASLLDELRELYVMAAAARGASRTRVVLRHAFRNSLIPIVTIVGLQFGSVLTGTVITETIFAWPGIGRLLIQSIGFRDYPLVQGCILLIAVTYVAMNLLTDVAYGWLDPRIRFE